MPQAYLRKAVQSGLARADLSDTLPPGAAAEAKTKFKAAVANRDIFVTGNDWEWSALTVPRDDAAFLETIKAGEWDTVLGKLSFDAKGDIKVIDYVVYKWDAKGNYTEINPKGS